MALGLNSTLSLSEGNKKLPPCPILLFSNSEGVLQVYYFIHKTLPSICRKPEVIKEIQTAPAPAPPSSLTNIILGTPFPSQASPLNSLQSLLPSMSSTNGFSLADFISTPITTTQSKEITIANHFNFNSQPLQTTNKPLNDDLSKPINTTSFNTPTSVQQTPTKIPNEPSSSSISNSKIFLQMVDEFQSKLKSLEKPLSKSSEPLINIDRSLENLITSLNNMTTSLQTSNQSIKSMTSEHIESMTKIQNALHQIKLSQKENLYHLLKDRELDPWTQSRLDSIKSKYDKLKHNLNVLLQLTHTTIYDKSLSINDDESENEDFLPDLEISLNTNETMKQRIQKRILELSHKVSETEKDLENICTKLNNTNLLSSNSTFTKTTMSSNRSFHTLDAQILSHLQATHPQVHRIDVPPPTVINLSSTIEQKKQSTIEITKPITPSIQPSTPKQTNSPTIESESFKNMLRIVRTSIDLFSGTTSPEQLQELSNTIATSPLSSTQKSNVVSINKTPNISKTTNITKTSNITKPLNTTMTLTNLVQTPAKSVTSTLPTISVTPATPATQPISSDTALKLQPNKPIIQTATDLSKAQTISISGDSAIRSLLNNTVSTTTTITSIPNQPTITSTSNQGIKPPFFGNTPNTSAAPVMSQSPLATSMTATTATPVISTPSSIQSSFGAPLSPASTVTTSVQSTSPTTKPIMPTSFGSFGSRPMFGGTAFNLTSTTSSGIPFGSTATSANTGSLFGSAITSTAPTPTSFGGGFGATTTTTATTSVPSPFGSGFVAPAATAATTSAPTAGIFGAATNTTSSPFGGGFGSIAAAAAATTSAPSTGSFSGGFGSNTTATSPFGASFSPAASTPSASSFGGFGAASTGTTFGGFGAAASPAPTSTSSSGVFGSSGFGFTSTLPAASTAPSTFGSGFSGFNTQSTSSGPPTGFSFSGFGSQPSDATATQSNFGSFGAPSAATQPPSPFGGSMFGGASGQPPSFGAATSSFGASSTQSTSSPSFTTYRK